MSYYDNGIRIDMYTGRPVFYIEFDHVDVEQMQENYIAKQPLKP